ncbi:MAG: thiamine pyrophosphate-dependent enzyme [Clostridia bacterium]|jgi:acetolactate synthase-1/2/3 large subunit
MINNYKLISTLSDLCTKDDIISPGMSGNGVCHLFQAFRVKFGQRFTFAGALGAMGSEPIAIGACIATGKRTICLTGDGGFQMNVQELEVVKREKLPIKFFVINNGGYGSIVNTQNKYFEGRYVGCKQPDLTLPSLKKIADVYDLKYYIIKEENELRSTCKKALSGNEPCLVEVIESENQETVMRVGTRLVDGKPISGKFTEV